MFSVLLPGQWLLNLHQPGSWDQVMPDVGSNCIVLKATWKQSPGTSASFEITSQKAPSYECSAWSRPTKAPRWLQEAVDRSACATCWGVGVRSQGPTVCPAVREPVVLSKDWRRWKRGKDDVPEDRGPPALIPLRMLSYLSLPVRLGDVWLYWHCCPLMGISYGLITIYMHMCRKYIFYLYMRTNKSGMKQGYRKCSFQLHQLHTSPFAGNRWDMHAQILQEAGANRAKRQQGIDTLRIPCNKAAALSPPALGLTIAASGTRKGKWRVSLTPVIPSCHRASWEAPMASAD